jgi:antibiotic biosynthesis monooxygenase (ABM) superfamily enzyme
MTTIKAENSMFTLVNVFTVDPENQQKVIEVLCDAVEQIINKLPGFISSNLHRSFDGKYVVNYVQWRSKEDFEAMLHDPKAIPHMWRVAALWKSYNPILCEVSNVMESVIL